MFYIALKNCEIDLAKNEKICYTCDELSRVTKKSIEVLTTGAITDENYSYDSADNRLSKNKGLLVEYDLDGNQV